MTVDVNPVDPPVRLHMSGAPCCNARNRAGELCGAPAIRGLEKCRFHCGMSLGEARARGLRNIGALLDTSVETVANIMADPDATDPAKLAAARTIIDHALDRRNEAEAARIDREQVAALTGAVIELLDHLQLHGEARDEAVNVLRSALRAHDGSPSREP